MINEETHPTLVLLSLDGASPLPFSIAEPKKTPSSVPPRVDGLPFRSPGDDYDLATCAAWRASFDWGTARGVVIVTEDDVGVGRAERFWVELSDARAVEGDSALLDRFDASYFARIEELSGGLSADDVLLLMTGERTLDARLDRLPRAAHVRIVRAWMRRTTAP